jgi:hypothetical protein
MGEYIVLLRGGDIIFNLECIPWSVKVITAHAIFIPPMPLPHLGILLDREEL